MAFQDIQSKRPARPPAPAAPPAPNYFPPPPASADFSDIYEPDAPAPTGPLASSPSAPPPAPKPASEPPGARINPKLERLIEIVCENMGSTPEEVRDLKARAAHEPAPIEAFCSSYYDESIRPRREQIDPLAEAISQRPDCFCFKYILPSGESAVLCVSRAARPELAMYHNQTLSHFMDEDHPFHEDAEPEPAARMY